MRSTGKACCQRITRITSYSRHASPVFALLVCVSAHAAIPTSEAQALVDLYNATNGASWTNNTNWLTAGAECTWFGVTCDGSATHVTGLALASNQLVGTLSDMSALTALQTLDLSHNQLTGSFPALSGSGLHPSSIFINDNELSGPLPADLSSLAYGALYAQNNQLTGALPSLPYSMYNLDLHNNQLTGSISAFNGTSWTYIDLSGNQLSGSVPSVAALANLGTFRIAYNQLSGSMSSLAALSNLVTFEIAHNQLTGAPPALPTNGIIELYDISYNAFTGNLPTLPAENPSYPSLVSFIVDHNELSGPVPDIHDRVLPSYRESQLCPNHLDPHTTTQTYFDWNTATNQSFFGDAHWYAGCDDWIFVMGFE